MGFIFDRKRRNVVHRTHMVLYFSHLVRPTVGINFDISNVDSLEVVICGQIPTSNNNVKKVSTRLGGSPCYVLN